MSETIEIEARVKALERQLDKIKLEHTIKFMFDNDKEDICRLYFDWSAISFFHGLPMEFIEKYHDKLNWKNVSTAQKLSEEFIEKHADKVDWPIISRMQDLSIPFMKKHIDRISLKDISIQKTLTEDFIEEYKDKISWDYIGIRQELSDDFIIKHSDRMHWTMISIAKKMSLDFIRKFKDNLLYGEFCQNRYIRRSGIHTFGDPDMQDDYIPTEKNLMLKVKMLKTVITHKFDILEIGDVTSLIDCETFWMIPYDDKYYPIPSSWATLI